MAATPTWKVYSEGGEYLAACKYTEDAAILVSGLGKGASIRSGHRKADTVWREGHETKSAEESYDHVTEICHKRARILSQKQATQ